MRYTLAGLLLLLRMACMAQHDVSKMHVWDDSLKLFSFRMVNDTLPQVRSANNEKFIRTLVQALKTPYSFNYRFDSVRTVSRLYAPDSSFRIFTWQIEIDPMHYVQKGAIQMNTKDGSLKLFPLIDVSEFTERPEDSIRDKNNWIGAVYYRMLVNVYHGKKYYTLIGFDDHNLITTRKWIDVLSFDASGEPRFGGGFMYKSEPYKPKGPIARYLLEYKKDANPRLNYDPELGMIVLEHLVSESNRPDLVHTLVPDGDYEGFQWRNGIWVQLEKIWDQKQDMRGVDPALGNPPGPK